ncbi:MAG: NAD(P)-binding domain-containing protein, partial [Leptospiraceae bacterium]|nr:NAD(P)-binding domain-containing protein [Leptospiraceae bacterium]
MICFLGCGLLGSAMVRAALRRGEKPAVWNRTLEKAARLAREGAVAYPLVEDAVAQASAVHLVLSDDSAVDAILQKIVPALPKGVTLFDHTTTSIAGARRRTQELAAQGIEYLHIPVFM